MVSVSERFHEAVAEGAQQRILIEFDDQTVLTSDDISASAGVAFDEMFNPDTDLTVGAAPSSTLSFTILNDDLLLENVAFGKFNAYLGVKTGESTHEPTGIVSVTLDDGTVFSGHAEEPYFRENGIQVVNSPGWPVKAIVVKDQFVYVFGDNNQTAVYMLGIGTTWGEVGLKAWHLYGTSTWGEVLRGQGFVESDPSHDMSFFYNEWTVDKLREMVAENRAIVRQGTTVKEFRQDGRVEVFEYAPLGRFVAERPAIVRSAMVGVEARDQMVLFDKVLEGFKVTFPITVDDLLTELCKFLGVERVNDTFINQRRVLKQSIGVADMTGRELLEYIAEAACAYARFNREGKLELAWFRETRTSFDERDYSWFMPGEQSVAVIDKLKLGNSDSDYGTIIGGGKNAYIILDNPCLWAESYEDGQAAGNPIFNRLKSVPPFYPGEVTIFTDWAYQAGDVVTIRQGGKGYRFPIYTMTMNWNGSAKIMWANSGNATREPLSAVNRQAYARSQFEYQIKTDVRGLQAKATEIETKVDEELETVRTEFSTEITQTARDFSVRAQQIEEDLAYAEGDISDLYAQLEVTAKEISAKVGDDELVAKLNLSKEGLKIDGKLIDITGTVSLNGDTVIDENGTLYTENMVATNAMITGVFEAAHTYIGENLVSGESFDGLFFSATEQFNPSRITGVFGRDSNGDYHVSVTESSLYLDTNYSEPIYMNASEMYLAAYATDEVLRIGRDDLQTDYRDLCVYPQSSSYGNPRGNCGTPAHPWDTCTADQFFSDNGIKSRSSRELKTDIRGLDDMGAVIDRLEPVEFRYKHDRKGRLHYGLIFEDTEKVAPVLCDRVNGGVDPRDRRIGYEAINIMLLKEVQSLRRRMEGLEKCRM